MRKLVLMKPTEVLLCSVKRTKVLGKYRAKITTIDGIRFPIVSEEAVVRGGIMVWVRRRGDNLVIICPVSRQDQFEVRPSQVVPLKSRGA